MTGLQRTKCLKRVARPIRNDVSGPDHAHSVEDCMRKLSRHMIFRHKQEPSVVEAVKMNKVDRLKAFSKLRREGIYQFNLKQIKMKKPVLRTEGGLQKKDDLVKCNLCKSFIHKESFYKHKRICNSINDDSKNGDETVSDNNSGGLKPR